MNFSVFCRTYNRFGGHKSISLVASFLESTPASFGDSISEIEVTLNFKQDGPPRRSLEAIYEQFHRDLCQLPRCTFSRKKKQLTLEFEGKFTTGYEIQKERKPLVIRPEWVEATLREIIEQFPTIKSKFIKTDDFDLDGFEVFLRHKLASLPKDVLELERIRETVAARRKAHFDTLDEWEKLGIDWEEYHPLARRIVNHPYQWSASDDFAPNGNDTGADTLAMFRDWHDKNSNVASTTFLNHLLSNWQVDPEAPYLTDYTSQTYFQTTVGLAFAEAKIRGMCEQRLKSKAIAAIEKYLQQIENDHKWPHKAECEEKLILARETIKQMPNKAL